MIIGTAGWAIPKAVAQAFPGEGTQLARYAAIMAGAEINSSFYRPHRRATYEKWAGSTPGHFRFAVKLPKLISHTCKLVEPESELDTFVAAIDGLSGKLGVVLVQLAPSLAFDRDVASHFYTAIRHRLDPAVGIATEPRHASWFTPDAEQCLVEHRIARVGADPVRAPGGEQPGGWTGLRYRRLHGSPRVYYSAYDDLRLAALATALGQDDKTGAESWCIFDNTASGAALGDALKLRALPNM